MGVCQNLVPLVNIKIAGKWMFIPLRMVLIGIDPYPHHHHAPTCSAVFRSSAILKVIKRRTSVLSQVSDSLCLLLGLVADMTVKLQHVLHTVFPSVMKTSAWNFQDFSDSMVATFAVRCPWLVFPADGSWHAEGWVLLRNGPKQQV